MNLSPRKTISALFIKRVEKQKDQIAIGSIKNDKLDFINFEKYYDIVECIYYGLNKSGLEIDDKVAILSSTCKEWHFFDLANLCSGATVIPLYQTYRNKDIAYILNHSESKFIFLENEEQAKKIVSIMNELNFLKSIIALKKLKKTTEFTLKEKFSFIYYDDLIREGVHLRNDRPGIFREKNLTLNENNIATIIYTSKTTGKLKGSMITQKALFSMIKNISNTLNHNVNNQDRTLTFLPLSHVFGRCDSLLAIGLGVQTIYAQSIKTILSDALIAQPTIIMGVPRVFEKIYSKLKKDFFTPKKFTHRKIFDFIKSQTKSYFEKVDDDLSPTISEIGIKNFGYHIIYSKARKALGGKVKFVVSGGAPLSHHISKMLRNSNITVLEGYGLTETAGACFLNPISRQIVGTVGVPLGDVQVKIASDGEVLIKSNCLFSGYFKEKELTKKAFLDEWFKTGDLGEINYAGYLKIKDRKKDIIVNSLGKNISPQKIETLLQNEKLISHAFVILNSSSEITAILSLEKSSIINLLGSSNFSRDTSLEEISKSEEVKTLIRDKIIEINASLQSQEKVKSVSLSPENFSVSSGHLTASQKLKRDWLAKHYKPLINSPQIKIF
ncbi:MAG: hypothetical protein CME68_11385 [Halobacteriovoraceae bacterium]|nr:hypothetical protein [Halobacteriovoraceae bacterium]